MMFSDQEIEALFMNQIRPKLIVPSLPEREVVVFAPIVYEPLQVPTLKKKSLPIIQPVAPSEPIAPFASSEPIAPFASSEPIAPFAPSEPIVPTAIKLKPLTLEMRRERNRLSALKFRRKQHYRLKELKFLLYGDENIQLPFEINRIVLPPEIPRRQRAIIFSSITRKRRKLTLDFLECALALKCRA